MKIGDLAARAGITTRTIRYYEELGIIEPDGRTEGGFRLYSEDQLQQLRIVQELKGLGFDLDRIRELFALKHSCETGGELALAMIRHLEEQQEEIGDRIRSYLDLQERNERAIRILCGCIHCTVQVPVRNCRECEVYRRHPGVPEFIDCSMYDPVDD